MFAILWLLLLFGAARSDDALERVRAAWPADFIDELNALVTRCHGVLGTSYTELYHCLVRALWHSERPADRSACGALMLDERSSWADYGELERHLMLACDDQYLAVLHWRSATGEHWLPLDLFANPHRLYELLERALARLDALYAQFLADASAPLSYIQTDEYRARFCLEEPRLNCTHYDALHTQEELAAHRQRFGTLAHYIERNRDLLGGVLNNQNRVAQVLYSLLRLQGPVTVGANKALVDAALLFIQALTPTLLEYNTLRHSLHFHGI
jgi:hypothetical protein